MRCLVGVEDQEGNHEGEEARGFSESETQNGVREELTCDGGLRQLIPFFCGRLNPRFIWIFSLTTEGWVAGDTGDQRAEDRADTNTGTSQTDGSQTGTLHLGSSYDGCGGGLSYDTARLHCAADHVAGEAVAGAVAEEEAIADKRLARRLNEGARDASGGYSERWVSMALHHSASSRAHFYVLVD